MEEKQNNIHKRGFASMSPERRKEIARNGGKLSGGNFKNDRKRASEVGRKGGLANRKGKDGNSTGN
jgi:general stress protein YciG